MNDTWNSTAGGLAVVGARLPYIDRRALSQAWFSALHVHEPQTAHGQTMPRVNGIATPRRRSAAAPRSARGMPAPALPAPGPRARSQSGRVPAEPPPHPSATKRRVARATSAAPPAVVYPPASAVFRLELDGGRIHLVVQRRQARLLVVALCSERNVERVRRALALASEHLRLRGEALCADVRTVGPGGAA